MYNATERFDSLKARPGSGKRLIKSKLLLALGATGANRPFPGNTERIIERKMLYQNAFNPNPSGGGGGGGSVHLLNGLVSYWQLESNAGTDSQNGNTLSETGGVSHPAGGIINNYCSVAGVGVGTYLLNCPANLQAGPGVSFSFQIWVKYAADTVPIAANAYASATQVWRLYLAVKNIRWLCYDSLGTASDWDTGLVLPTTGWHHILCGFNAATNQQFLSLDNGAQLTNLMPSNLRASNGIFVLGADGSAITDNVGIDECGYWNRLLTAAEITQLYNTGAGWPFGNFTP